MKEADSTTHEGFMDYQLCSTIRGLRFSLNQLKVSSLQDEYKHSRSKIACAATITLLIQTLRQRSHVAIYHGHIRE
jgi:hypothetical protein